ncbi:hypothetical protein [Chelativorans alearense]|nr:hypothetical protein [Chelativorans alearense]
MNAASAAVAFNPVFIRRILSLLSSRIRCSARQRWKAVPYGKSMAFLR